MRQHRHRGLQEPLQAIAHLPAVSTGPRGCHTVAVNKSRLQALGLVQRKGNCVVRMER